MSKQSKTHPRKRRLDQCVSELHCGIGVKLRRGLETHRLTGDRMGDDQFRRMQEHASCGGAAIQNIAEDR